MGSERPQGSAPRTVLILTSAVAGGHEAAGRAMQAELEEAGYRVVVMDGLRPLGRRIEWFLRQGYENQLRSAPWVYALGFRVVSYRPITALVRPLAGAIFAKRMLDVVRPYEPDVIISTYPLLTLALAHLRRHGRLTTPTFALVTDYGAHPFWVGPGLDLHLVPSARSAELVTAAGGRAAVARLPLAPGFRAVPAREASRAALGLPADAFIALIVGGAWGVGDLEETTAVAVESGAHAVVVTGTNEALRGRLCDRFGANERVRILGWTHEMPALMAAADCLIQNAGGMTCLEAIALGVPIIFYRTLPGHALGNARVMAAIGAAQWVQTSAEMRCLLGAAAGGERSLTAPRRESDMPALSAIESVLAGERAWRPARRRPTFRPVVTAAVVLAIIWRIRLSPRGDRLPRLRRALRLKGSKV